MPRAKSPRAKSQVSSETAEALAAQTASAAALDLGASEAIFGRAEDGVGAGDETTDSGRDRVLGKVVKSNSHCDYVVQLDDNMSTSCPPQPGEFGFGSFVRLDRSDDSRTVGIIYNSQLINPAFLNNGPRLSSEPDLTFTPDLIQETRTLLGVILIGTLEGEGDAVHGKQGIPADIVPVNAAVCCMGNDEIYRFHLDTDSRPQFRYYNLLLRYGGSFAAHLTEQVLQELINFRLFQPQEQRALEMLCRELTWRNTMGNLR